MKHNIESSVTPEVDRDRHLTARTLSDAELIQNGARHVQGVLRLTDVQLENVRTLESQRRDFAVSTPADASSVGFSLYSRREQESAKSIETHNQEIANRTELEEKLHDVTAPFAGIFVDLERVEPPRRRLIGKQKPVLSFDRQIGNEDVRYAFTPSFERRSGKKASLSSVEMKVIRDDGIADFALNYTYANGALNGIELRNARCRKPNGYDKADWSYRVFDAYDLQDTTLSRFLMESSGNGYMTISLKEGDISMSVRNGQYRFNAYQGVFDLVGPVTQTYGGDDPELQWRVDRPKAISVDDFVSMTNTALHLIPRN